MCWHVLASMAYCTVHVAGMQALRHAGYATVGQSSQPADWWAQWGYEYLKDVRSYTLTVSALVGYRFVLLRLQGEARVLDAPEPPALPDPPPSPSQPAGPPRPQGPPGDTTAPPVPPRSERFLVRKLRSEFLIAASDIA